MALDKTTLDAYIQALYDDDGQLSTADYQLIINYILSNGNPETDPRDLFQFRRGDLADLPTLAQAEPAFTLDTLNMFIGGLTGNVKIARELVNITAKDYGAKGDGVTDNAAALQNAFNNASGNIVYIPKGIYYTSTKIDVPENTKIYSEGGVLVGGLNIKGDNVEIHGLKFKAYTGAGTFPESAVWIEEVNNTTINGCEFDKMRIVGVNNGLTQYNGLIVKNCLFTGDWSGYTEESNSNLIHINAWKNVIIDSNKFFTTNSNRFLKITAAEYVGEVLVGEYHSENVIITNNHFEGTCKKQVIDFFAGTDKIIVANNVVNVTGNTTVFENKTDGGAGQAYCNTHRLMIFNNNIITTDASLSVIFVQGAYGLSFEGDEQIIKISDNIIKYTNAAPTNVINIRGFHYVDVKNNNIKCTGEDAQLLTIDCRASKNLEIDGNIIIKGSIAYQEIGSTTGGEVYNAPLNILSVNSNNVQEHRSYGGVYLRYLTGGKIIAKDNYLQTENTSPTLASIAILDCIIENMDISGNYGVNTADATKEKLQISTSTVDRYTEINNSWQRRERFSNVAPTIGTWKRGDVVYNNQPTAGGSVGWVCVADGTPGTWKTFGTIEV